MKYILSVAVFIATTLVSNAQVGIGTTTPDASAVLHLETSATVNQGLIIPRMSTTDRDTNILSPIAGIMIFNTDDSEFQVSTLNNGWLNLGAYATVVAAIGTPASTGKVGVGTSSPDPNTILDVSSTTKGLLLPLLTAEPVAVTGMIYYDSTTDKVRGCSDGTTWADLN